jgi:hypothetical protein
MRIICRDTLPDYKGVGSWPVSHNINTNNVRLIRRARACRAQTRPGRIP